MSDDQKRTLDQVIMLHAQEELGAKDASKRKKEEEAEKQRRRQEEAERKRLEKERKIREMRERIAASMAEMGGQQEPSMSIVDEPGAQVPAPPVKDPESPVGPPPDAVDEAEPTTVVRQPSIKKPVVKDPLAGVNENEDPNGLPDSWYKY